MLFNVMVHVDADDEQHVQEVLVGWVLTPGAVIHNVSTAYPVTLANEDLPVVADDGNVHKSDWVPEEPPPEPEPEEPVDPGWSGGTVPPELEGGPPRPDTEPVEPPDEVEPPPDEVPPAVAAFAITPPAPVARNTDVNFDGTPSTGAGALAYAWAFGDGATDVGARVTYRYKGKGDYDVSLVVTDEAGQADEQAQTIKVT